MTFHRGLCEDLFDTFGRDDRLRHAYNVYLWRRALEFVYHSSADIGPTAGAEFYSAIQAPPWSKRYNELDAERARRM
jgi:hypothetical protein